MRLVKYTTHRSFSGELSHRERERMMRGISARHPDWVLKAVEYLDNSANQPDFHKFCKDNGLDEVKFGVFFDLMMADIEGEIDADPFLIQICSLPTDVQNEYARMSRQGRDIQLKIAELYTGIIGEKVELRDFYDEKASKRIDDKLKKALDKKTADNLLKVFEVSQLFKELEAIDYERKQFLKRHGIN